MLELMDWRRLELQQMNVLSRRYILHLLSPHLLAVTFLSAKDMLFELKLLTPSRGLYRYICGFVLTLFPFKTFYILLILSGEVQWRYPDEFWLESHLSLLSKPIVTSTVLTTSPSSDSWPVTHRNITTTAQKLISCVMIYIYDGILTMICCPG